MVTLVRRTMLEAVFTTFFPRNPRALRWLFGLIALVVVAALLATACGGDDSQSQQQQQSPSDSETSGARDSETSGARADRQDRQEQQGGQQERQQQDQEELSQQQENQIAMEQAQVAQAAPARPRVQGELRIARAEPINLDPAQITDVSSAVIAVEVFGGLLTLDPELRIAPDLAVAVPEPMENDDGTVTYRFILRDDATFHNGKRITADDVKWSIERHGHPETLSPTAPDFLADIYGAAEYMRGRADEILGLQVIDDSTIEIVATQLSPTFLYKLTFPTAFVVDREEVESDPDRWALAPNGSGPFRLAEWTLGESLVLERFDDYHLEPALVESVFVRFAGGAIEQFENDELDQAFVTLNDIERVRDPASDLNEFYITRSELSIFYVAFNVNQPPFDDPLVRRALAHAIDKTTIVDEVLQGLSLPARQIVPPGLAAHDEDYFGLAFDPELAAELLAQSTYAGTPLLDELRLTIPGGGATPGPTFEAIQEMWRVHLSLEVDIQQIEFASFISDLDRGLYAMFSLGWSLDYPDPENVLDYKFYSASLGNDTGLNDPEIDELILEARYELDEARRSQLYRNLDTRLVEDAVWIPLTHSVAHEVVKPYVENYVPTRMVIPQLRYIRLAE